MDTRRSRVRRAGVGTLLVLLAGLAAGSALAVAAPSGVAVHGWSAAGASRFWTAARMRRAVPVEVAGPGAASGAAGRAGTGAGAAAGIGSGAASRAATEAGASRDEANDPTFPSSTTVPHPRAPHSDFAEVPDPTDSISRVNGAIFFEFDGELARCSGTSVNAPNLSVVFTAGHCVHDLPGPHSDWYRGRWTFVPAYRFGQRPFGVFPAVWLDSTKPWVREGNENFDVGAAVVGRNEKGQRLAAAVGADKIAFNLPPSQLFDVHGYPVGRPFDGETQRLCSGAPYLGHDPESILTPGPLTLAIPCQVTGGASGGGWTIHGNVLNGVTDYGYPEDPQTDFGAYFGPEVARLYQRVTSR